MSELVQENSSSVKDHFDWQSVNASKHYHRVVDTDNKTETVKFHKIEQVSYATMASRHYKQAPNKKNHSSHLSENLHPIILKQFQNDDYSSNFSHPPPSKTIRNSFDASTSPPISPKQSNAFLLKEKEKAHKTSVSLAKTSSNQKKPPILLPKPNIAPKPKVFDESSIFKKRNTRESSSLTTARNSEVGFSRTKIQDALYDKRNLNRNKQSKKNTFRNQSEIVEENRIEREKYNSNCSDKPELSTKLSRSNTVPQLSSNSSSGNAKNNFMEVKPCEEKNCIGETIKTISRNVRPDVPVKPKLKKKQFSKSKNLFISNTENEIFSESLASAPFSKTRSKFETMKIEFKQPISEPAFSHAAKAKNKQCKNIAQELFKDILEMQSLENFVERYDKNDKNNLLSANEEQPVEALEAISKFASDQFELSNTKNPTSFDKYSLNNVPAPISPKESELRNINFTDLPAPPNFSTPPETLSTFEQSIADNDKNLPTTYIERNALSHESSVFRHKVKDNIAPGFVNAQRSMNVLNEFSNFSKEKTNDSESFVKAEENLSNQGCPLESKHDGERFVGNKASVIENSIVDNLLHSATDSLNSLSENYKSLHKISQTLNLEEEIFYYDNMDIIEKVKQNKENDKICFQFSKNESVGQSNEKIKQTAVHGEKFNRFDESVSRECKDDFHNAIGSLENEYLKLKDNLQIESVEKEVPPKLPPKQLKFNRKQAVKSADMQVIDESHTIAHDKGGRHNTKNKTALRVRVDAVSSMSSSHVATPIPKTSESLFNNLIQPQVSLSSNQSNRLELVQQLMAQQMSHEDARARQLVDEPLAPIIEEDSNYGDSSSCASFIHEDDEENFSNHNSVRESLGCSKFLTFSRQQQFTVDDGGTTESESTIPGFDSQQSDSLGELSDTSSVRWQENPLLAPVEQKNASEVATVGNKSIQPSKTLNKDKNERGEDVAPYGMVDLSTFQPSYSEIKSAQISSLSVYFETELTPSSIMQSLSQFKSNHFKSPKQGQSVDENCSELVEMPNFPLDVEVDRKKIVNGSLQNNSHPEDFEPPGYDNLEKYGGETREETDKKWKLREASLSEKYIDTSIKNDSVNVSSKKDSLLSEPGLSNQSARSRGNYSFPVSESHLARHSSAVRAVDRFSGNLKRAKQSGFSGLSKKLSSDSKLKGQAKSQTPMFNISNKVRHVESKSDKSIPDVVKQPDLADFNKTKLQHNVSSESLHKHNPTGDDSSSLHFPDNYDEAKDDAIVNPYEEVLFPSDGEIKEMPSTTTSQTSPEQTEAKTKVQEVLDNVQPPESTYRPKPPMPRYPVDYDNFYLGKPQSKKDKEHNNTTKKSQVINSEVNSPFLSKSSISSDNYKNLSGNSTNSAKLSPTSPKNRNESKSLQFNSNNSDENKNSNENKASVAYDTNVPHNASDYGNRSLGSQLRYFLGGGQDSKHTSPGIRRKRSLLKRSKSPGGSRRSKSPSKSSTGDDISVASESVFQTAKESCTDDAIKSESGKSSDTESFDRVQIRRSASQRIVERRGKGGLSQKNTKTSEDDSSEHTIERRKKEDGKLRLSSRWRRSKSQDRESPTRSKSKERKLFGRSKSQERTPNKENKTKEITTEEKELRGRKLLRRNRSSSRKRDKREKSSDGKEDENYSERRGRNPVKFIKKLLRRKSTDEDIHIVHSTFEQVEELSDSAEALSTILAYQTDQATEKETWNPPRPNPPQQKILPLKESSKVSNQTKKVNKALKSPPSHRAKKFSSAHASNKPRSELSTGSSSECIDKRRTNKAFEVKESYELHRHNITRKSAAPQNSEPSFSRKSSFTNSVPSSDSDQLNKHDIKRNEIKKFPSHKENLFDLNQINSVNLKTASRKNHWLNREYDSDTGTSVIPTDADSSDLENSNPEKFRSAVKVGTGAEKVGGGVTKRLVRINLPRRSKSDPSIFVPAASKSKENSSNKNMYHCIKETSITNKDVPDKKIFSKSLTRKRRNQKQIRRQTAPVDLAYEAHQRQKYKTLVSLNAQTLRKVTEKWLSEWRNQLPVGGFLITSWSDVALASHRPMCMVANSVVYEAISTGSKKFNLACQLYDQQDIDDRMARRLDNCSSLPAHPNMCGVCSHFHCRVPRSLLDPSSGGGAAEAICVVLTSRPRTTLQEFLDNVARKKDATEFHRELLLNILQLLQGISHLQSSGFNFLHISSEHLVITEDREFLQILPHIHYTEQRKTRKSQDKDSGQSSDSDSAKRFHQMSVIQQIGRLTKTFFQTGHSLLSHGHVAETSSLIVPETKYTDTIIFIIKYFKATSSLKALEAAQIVQCALWGPDALDDVGVDDVSPYAALELWIEMEQAKLVNSLAVLASNEKLIPSSFFKHQFFANVSPQVLFSSLKVLQRI